MRSGRVWKFGDNINTDLMLPGPYLYRSAEEQARAVFMNNRPDWINQVQNGDAIVGGFNYGMGSSRPAARSLRMCGVGFLLAETINGLFFRNAVNYGLLACECSGVSTAFDEGDTAEFDVRRMVRAQSAHRANAEGIACSATAPGDDARRRHLSGAGARGIDRIALSTSLRGAERRINPDNIYSPSPCGRGLGGGGGWLASSLRSQ